MAAVAEASGGGEVGAAHQHHAQLGICASRAKYREGRRPRAVKVYTVNLESRYLLIQGVPALGVMKELVEQFALYGAIEEYHPLDDYPAEEFTEVYLIKFQKYRVQAKRKLDERSFFGSLLHVCYAPEFESVQETREKLQDRRKYIARATSNKEQLLVRKQASTTSFQKSFQLDISGSYTSEASTSNWNSRTHVYDPHDQSCYEPSLKSIAVPSGEHCNSVLVEPLHVADCAKRPKYFHHSSTVTQSLQQEIHNTSACCNLQRKTPYDNGLGRFMPRTTQLQERKRRRNEDNKLALLGSDSGSKEIIIGPRLPEASKIDLEDDSLNTSANLIRNRLKEVVTSVQTPKQSEGMPMNSQTEPAIKPRRRI